MEISSETLSRGVAIAFFVLAFVYTLADFDTMFDKDKLVPNKRASPFKYALGYVFGYAAVVIKVVLVLLFVYVFIVVYNLAIVGIFKPLLSDNVDSASNIKFSTGANEIVEKARGSYFEAIKQVTKTVMGFTFGFIDVPQLLVVMCVIVPTVIFVTSFTYYYSHPASGEDKIKQMNTAYHMFMMFIFALIIVMCLFAIYQAFL
jgi:hypothetical protein